jgi:cytochrome c
MRLPIAIAATFAAVALAGPAFAESADDIIARMKCHKCHTEKTTKKAPSWASVAEKYKVNADAPNKIFLQLKNGGRVGDEEDHLKITGASDADIKSVVQVVLSSK